MIVADLQQFVRNLGTTLTSAGAKGPGTDLERMAVGLEIFRAQSVAQFCDFLAQAENYARTGVLPTTGKGRAKAAAPSADTAEQIRAAAQRVLELYERATDPALQYTTIDAELKAIDKQLKKDATVQLAREVGISAPLKTKKDAMDAIKRKITERKESFERTQFGGATP